MTATGTRTSVNMPPSSAPYEQDQHDKREREPHQRVLTHRQRFKPVLQRGYLFRRCGARSRIGDPHRAREREPVTREQTGLVAPLVLVQKPSSGVSDR